MKDQYFGDLNDYLKYGLLRAILEAGQVTLGVCWLLTNDDGGADGEIRKYLEEPEIWCRFDSDLYGKLRQLRESGVKRTVQNAMLWNVLPGASYYGELVVDDTGQRNSYFEEALRRLDNVDLLFFDPDNGLEVSKPKYGNSESSKYLYWREVEEAYASKHSLLIYQHFPRVSRPEFIARVTRELRVRLPGASVEWFRTSQVVFLAAFRPDHSVALRKALDLVNERWRGQICVSNAGESP